jgi:type IV pilus assembly protein PilN
VRLNINLATKPYQDVRRVLKQWGGLVLLLAVCTAALVWFAVSSWRESRDVNARISELRSEIAALDRQHSQALAVLRLPQNASVVETSKFLNGLIARKSFSWTRVFMQLEEIMPPRLHVVSISPELQPKTNTVEVHLSVAGTSREAALELVKRLEQSPSFRDARIVEESTIPEKNRPDMDRESSDTVKFQVNATYVPKAAPARETAGGAVKEAPTAKTQVAQTKVAQTEEGAR